MNSNQEMFPGYGDTDASYPDADPDAYKYDYIYTDTDLSVRIMSLFYNHAFSSEEEVPLVLKMLQTKMVTSYMKFQKGDLKSIALQLC